MAGLATSITIITALCIVRFRKKSSPPTSISEHYLDKEHNVLINESTTPPTTSLEHEQPSTSEGATLENEMSVKVLPLPPALQQHPQVNPKFVKRATSERRLSLNLSRRMMPRSLSVARNWDQEGGSKKGALRIDEGVLMKTKEKMKTDDSVWMKTKEKLKRDDSVWMKTIILGGKCVPDEEDDVVIYEEKGKKISAYHPRKHTSSSISSQSSYYINADNPDNPDALSVHKSSEERINNTCE
ncbi:uncharacterized protein HKW66_Vig0223800 [Vigna angularis]|nr:uncharacterized protein HKW66_Vig0223800 [Vigna angularis]